MIDFYQGFLTDKSFEILKDLKKRYQFILIGGWAVYFYTHSLRSKDIDIIIDFSELEKIKKDFPLEKNERIKKYQIKIEEIDIDIYLPYYSNLGVAVEKIIKNTQSINGFEVLEKEILLITKLKAYENRKSSIKGQKDLIDILSLVFLEDFDFEYFFELVKSHKLAKYVDLLEKILKETKEAEEINLNRFSFGKKKGKILEKIKSFQVMG